MAQIPAFAEALMPQIQAAVASQGIAPTPQALFQAGLNGLPFPLELLRGTAPRPGPLPGALPASAPNPFTQFAQPQPQLP